ncbi:MAG: PAS domain-containing protein [Marinilabiliales bacterium]|nr:PAS domain-containing protein [Marinilabiliales bacterium]
METNEETASADRCRILEQQLAQLREKNFLLEDELKRTAEAWSRYQLIAEFAHDWEFWLNPKGAFEWISPSSNDLTGFTPEDFMKDPGLFYELILPEDESKVRHFVKEVIGFMQIGQTLEFRILTKTKQLRWCEMNSRAVFDNLGNYLGQRCAIRDVSRLKTALQHIRDIAEQQVWETKAKERYREELAGKDRELVTSLIRLAQKNELEAYLKRNLTLIRNSLSAPMQQKVATLIARIEEHQRMHLFNWEEFKLQFEKVHQGFFSRLKGRYPTLTAKDLRICAYIHLGLSTKELAGLLNITQESAEIGRIRLRKKLGLTHGQNLSSFLQVV